MQMSLKVCQMAIVRFRENQLGALFLQKSVGILSNNFKGTGMLS